MWRRSNVRSEEWSGLLEVRWLTLAALAVAVSFVIAAPLNEMAHHIYNRLERRLVRREDRGGAQRLELTHDLLVGVVRASRDIRRRKEEAESERLALLEAQERALAESQRQRIEEQAAASIRRGRRRPGGQGHAAQCLVRSDPRVLSGIQRRVRQLL